MTKVTVELWADEVKALTDISKKQRRAPHMQAAVIIRRALTERGYLQDTAVTEPTAQEVQHGSQ